MDELFSAYSDALDTPEEVTEGPGASSRKRKEPALPTPTNGNGSPDADAQAPPSKRQKVADAPKEKLELPLVFFDPGEEARKLEDESKNHGGRYRTTPVVKGNWASLVCLAPPEALFPHLLSLQDSTLADATSTTLVNKQLHPTHPEEMHIRTFFLREPEIDAFVTKLSTAIKASLIPPVDLAFQTSQLFTNDEKTRSFFGVNVGTGKEELILLIDVINGVLTDFGREAYYADPKPHLSLWWFLGDQPEPKGVESPLFAPKISFTVEKISLKVSNRLYTFPLTT